MFRSLVTLLLFGCLVQPGVADDCSGCTAYTTAAAAASSDADCTDLKTYISCTFKADDGTHCTVPEAHRKVIATKTCTTEQAKDTCKCEVDYYGTDLGDSTICDELQALDECLGKATEQTGCGDETLSELKAFSIKTKHAKTCPTTPAPVSCTAEGVCQHGGTCPTDGDHKDKTPCDCPKEYEGPKCEKKKNAGTMVSPKDGLILTTFISCLIMLFA